LFALLPILIIVALSPVTSKKTQQSENNFRLLVLLGYSVQPGRIVVVIYLVHAVRL